MSATFRKASSRRTHHERSAPAGRSKFGILERHKDYKLRAKNYHMKMERLDAMREAARFKNPDEFYFAMQRSKVIDGKHRAIDEPPLSPELEALAESQNLLFVETHMLMNARRINKLRMEKPLPLEPQQHIFFTDEEDKADTVYTPLTSDLQDNSSADEKHHDHGSSISHDEYSLSESESFAENDLEQDKAKAEEKEDAVEKELRARIARQVALEKVAKHMRVRKLSLSKEKKRQIEVTSLGLPVFKFAQVRKR